jgi:hypothetical protein
MTTYPVFLTNASFLFDAVVNSVGGGYDNTSGVFTAPEAGDYIFYAQVMNHANSDR